MVTTVKIFNIEKSANGFAKRVKGDVSKTKNGKFKVRYVYSGPYKVNVKLPHEENDFGYPNEYWR